MKKIATQENSASAWERSKQARNEVNNAIKSAKKQPIQNFKYVFGLCKVFPRCVVSDSSMF